MKKVKQTTYRTRHVKCEQHNQRLDKLEEELTKTNNMLEEINSLLKAIVVNYILEDLEKSVPGEKE